MGLYSTNRVAAVAESTDALIESMDWTPDFSIGSVMEAVIQIHENDSKMFDSLIECDFISANNSMVMNEADAEEANNAADETKKVKIGERIHNIIEAIKSWIQKTAANFIAKVTDIVKSDKKICEKYKDVLKMENLKDFVGIADFRFPKDMITKDSIKSAANVKKFNEEFINKIQGAEDKEVITAALEEFKTKCNNEEEEFAKLEENSFEPKVDRWKPSADLQLKKILNSTANASDTIKEIKQVTASVIGELKSLQSTYKKSQIGFTKKKAAGEVETYKMKTLYDIASMTTKLFSKEFSQYTRVASRQLAACRKATILCGRAAYKAAKGESAPEDEASVKQESAIMYALGESSDEYVFECLA